MIEVHRRDTPSVVGRRRNHSSVSFVDELKVFPVSEQSGFLLVRDHHKAHVVSSGIDRGFVGPYSFIRLHFAASSKLCRKNRKDVGAKKISRKKKKPPPYRNSTFRGQSVH